MNDELEEWMFANKMTDIKWTEVDILREYNKKENQDKLGSEWCVAMMAGVLGSWDKVKDKYPEMML